MADSFLTLADLIKLNDMNLADLQVTDLLQDAPLLAALAADVASNGTNHSYLKETGAPVVGFRAVNTGRENSVDADTKVSIALQILDASFAEDVAVCNAYTRGGAPAYLARRSKRHLKAAFAGAEKQILYGTGNDSDGFVGLADAETLDSITHTETVFNAGGTTVNGASSVYLIRTNDDGNDCTVITGQDGQIDISDYVTIEKTDGTGKHYPAFYVPICGWLGLQIGSKYSVVRIANLTAESGHTLTDDILSQAMELFPASRGPTLIGMSKRSRGQLQRSRTATNATGAPAPTPTEYEGIPIICSDQIVNTEAILT